MIVESIALALGAVGWTLTEYCVHRWSGHRFTNNFFGKEHVAHHSRGNYFAASWKKAVSAAAVVVLLIGPAVWVAGPWVGSAFVVGFVGMYLAYEVLHRLEHVHAGIGAYGRWARRHHFYHHFHDPSMNHGVTSPVWDLVFRTYVKPGEIQVPEKLQMGWLCDPETGEVWDALRGRYALRRTAARRAG